MPQKLKREYKYIHFDHLESKGKTMIWLCLNNKSQFKLGTVKWHGAWRQYCFFPEAETIFNRGCLEDINDFIYQLMNQRK